jgi:glutathionylspermidine synthase
MVTEETPLIGQYSGGDLMKGSNVNKHYIDMVMSNQEAFMKDYFVTVDRVSRSNAKYKGKPVPFLYNPMFFTPHEEDYFKDIASKMLRIGNKVTDKFIEDPIYRASFGYPKFIEEMIIRENKYGINVPIGRFDIFFNDIGDFKFCELNTDGSSAMNEDNTLGRILLKTEALKAFGEEFRLENRELIDNWVIGSLRLYRRWKGEDHKPNVAIVDFVESGTSAEFLEFQKAYERAGLTCIIADPRDLEYRDGALYKDMFRIDLIYRRIVTFELIQKSKEIPEFIRAYMNDAMCTIGTVRSQVIHNKLFFKMLHEQETLQFLTEEERDFVKEHIPFTGVLGGAESVLNEVIVRKNKYIIKPMDMNASQGVFVGRDLADDEWKDKVSKAFGKDYLYQEFIVPPQREFLVAEESGFRTELFKSIVGLFVYNESYSGMYTRLSKENIISGITNYYSVPNIIAY